MATWSDTLESKYQSSALRRQTPQGFLMCLWKIRSWASVWAWRRIHLHIGLPPTDDFCCPCCSVLLHEGGIWFKTLTEGLPPIILLFKTYYQVMSVTFCVLLFYPAPWFPHLLPKMLPIYSTAVCLSRTTIWGSYLGFGQILPWFWTYHPSWHLAPS